MKPTPLAKLFEAVARFSVARPKQILALAALGVVVALSLAATRLTLRTSNLDLVDPDLPEVARFRAFADEFGSPNMLVVVLEASNESGDETALRRAVDLLGPRLRSLPGVRSVIDRLPFDPDALEILGKDPYLASRDRGMFFLFVQPDDPHSSAETIAPFVGAVERALEDADLDGFGVRAGLTGMPRYALDDRDVIQRDISVLSLISLGLVLALFMTAFGALRRPLLAVLALLVGVVLTLGAVALHPGHLTLLSAFFGSILFGLGIDSGIHLVDRVEELVAEGLAERAAVPAAVGSLAWSLTTGTLTTASVLFAMELSGFRGFAELGFVAGVGILICLLTTITVLPALLVVWPAPPRGERKLEERRIGRVLVALHSRPLACVLATAGALAFFVGQPDFDTDYLDLQPAGSETVRLEREMVRRSDHSPEFAVFVAESREEVKDLTWKLVEDDTVGSVRSVRDFELLPGLPGAAPELDEAFRSSLVSPAGRFAVYAYPKADVWDPAEQQRFVAHMRAIDPEVTGMPLLGSFMVERSRRALDITASLGAALLLFWVLVDFRRPVPALLAMLPTVLTMVSLHALMKLFGLSWNPLDVMALPVVLGIAVDDGVHIVHRFLAEKGDLGRTLAGTGRSVVLTSATTIAAFGTLALTSHRGLASFALTLALGVATALVLSVGMLPTLLETFIRPRRRRREPARAAVALLALGLCLAAPLRAESPEARGDRAFAARAAGFLERGVPDPEPIAAAIEAWEEALAAQPESIELRFKLMEALYFQGSFTEPDPGRARTLFERMVGLSDRTLELAEGGTARDAVRAHFWAAITWGLWGMSHSRLASAGQGVATKIRDHAKAVIALDETYADGGGPRLLGRLYTATPKIPFFTGWIDRREGITLLRRALAISRRDPRNLLFLAEAILDYEPEHREEALALLRELAEREPDPQQLVEQSETLQQAQELLARLER